MRGDGCFRELRIIVDFLFFSYLLWRINMIYRFFKEDFVIEVKWIGSSILIYWNKFMFGFEGFFF